MDCVVRELHNYPGMGAALVRTALNSPVTRERNGACRALEQWAEASYDIPHELREALRNVVKDEINKDTKKTMKALLTKMEA